MARNSTRGARVVRRAMLGGVCASALLAGHGAWAQDGDASVQERDVIVVTVGTRVQGRTALQTAVPVDTLNASEMASTGGTETGRILQTLAPSFNFSSSSISDGTDSLRPATLRGLGPDQTLVLINGKRRHTAALIHVNTSVGRGTAGTDINAIPPAAIRGIEVLRDGAAAIYGSDAIAGVINFQLRNADHGGQASASYGVTYEGDGATFTAAVNKGFELGDGGFLNLTYEFRDRENTNRAGLSATQQYPFTNQDVCLAPAGPTCILDPREFTFDRQNFRIGDSDSEQHVVFANAGMPLSDNAEGYAFASWSHRENESGGFYRRANQFDRTVIELYPDGFLPLIRPTSEDKSIVAGIDWSLGDWAVDTSVNFGSNEFNFEIANSANASLGVASPTVADAGTLRLEQWVVNADASRDLELGGRPVIFAAGAEYRRETYEIEPGEPASYIDGGALNTNCPGCDVTPVPYSAGFQVFRGFSPAQAVDESRDSWSLYVEAESDVTDRLTVSGAARFEDFSDFGETLNGKLAARFDLVQDRVALRGAVSTGFRAPSMQQRFFNSVSTQFVTDPMTGATIVQERGTFRNDSPVAMVLGIPALKEETSVSFSAGVVATPTDNLTITVDAYQIDIDDRIVITRSFDDSIPQITAALNSVGATAAQFFTNAVDTRTQGVDIVASYDVPNEVLGGDLSLSAAANFTDTEITADLPAPGLLAGLSLFSAQDRSIVEEWQPEAHANFSADWARGPWSFTVRESYYGEYQTCEGACDTPAGAGQNIQTFGSKWLTDVQVNYDFARGVRLTLGANNLFDEVPDTNLIGQSRGGTLIDPVSGATVVSSPGVFQFSRRAAPFGFNGGYYYGRVSVDF